MKTLSQLTEIVYGSIPYPHLITGLDIESEKEAIRFDWRRTRYRMSLGGNVEEVRGGLLVTSDCAILMEELIKRAMS